MKNNISPGVIAGVAALLLAALAFLVFKVVAPPDQSRESDARATPPPDVSREAFYRNGGSAGQPASGGYGQNYGQSYGQSYGGGYRPAR
jgi:hypothetical protein